MAVSTSASQWTETLDGPVVCHFADGIFIATGPSVLIRSELHRHYDYGHRVHVAQEVSLEVQGSGTAFPLSPNADAVRLRRPSYEGRLALVEAFAEDIPAPGQHQWWIRIAP
ncbi:hypothetical protein KNT89_gp12 [Gordonia phage Petra]|uniref:Uncharacterized protein n=2 Tax=root TaxID=1 RepID=A0A2U8UKB1_9CAUD|nr:hypothetical protein [Gordonia westfalica]YP_010095406.1 hypothetical protein KNT89_gp12 [Gordonia phage Petra]AWN04125.1 hypothetical protein PBI_PETRA_12 [Gordonia phage Petra]SDU64593.1 hypothetical protein SAMN04488548_1342934 [Gordonia westfalica]